MSVNKTCTICSINIDTNICKKDKTVCKSYNKKKKRNKNNDTFYQNQQHASSRNKNCASLRQPKINYK